jgi:hypothetical protein
MIRTAVIAASLDDPCENLKIAQDNKAKRGLLWKMANPRH